MSKDNYTYLWIANYPEKGKPQQPHAECLRGMLPRAAARLGSEPTVILCNPADRDAIKDAFAGLTIGTRKTIPANTFWIGANGRETE